MQTLTGNVARIIFAVPFAIFGMMHFMHAGAMAGMVMLPGGVIWVYLTGMALILAAISIITGKQAGLANLLLALMLLVFTLSVHLPGMMTDNMMQKINQMSTLLRNISLIGAALTYAGLAGNGGGATKSEA